MDRNSRSDGRTGRKRETYYIRMRRRRQRQRLRLVCCLAVFFLGFLSGRAVTLRMMNHGERNAKVQAAAACTAPDSNRLLSASDQ